MSVAHLPIVIWTIGKAVTRRMVHPKGGYREGSNSMVNSHVALMLCLVFFNYLPAINTLAPNKPHKQFPRKFPAILTWITGYSDVL